VCAFSCVDCFPAYIEKQNAFSRVDLARLFSVCVCRVFIYIYRGSGCFVCVNFVCGFGKAVVCVCVCRVFIYIYRGSGCFVCVNFVCGFGKAVLCVCIFVCGFFLWFLFLFGGFLAWFHSCV